jgi:transporter family-2 protein
MLLAFLIGAFLPIQAALNGKMSKAFNGPFVAGFISFFVGTIGLMIFLAVTKKLTFSSESFAQTTWWMWLPGVLGAIYIVGIIVLMPKLGVALSFGLVVAGQLIVALIMDHYGLLGTIVKQISIGRIVGVILLVAGVYLIRKF